MADRNGTAISRALGVARRYASGGKVGPDGSVTYHRESVTYSPASSASPNVPGFADGGDTSSASPFDVIPYRDDARSPHSLAADRMRAQAENLDWGGTINADTGMKAGASVGLLAGKGLATVAPYVKQIVTMAPDLIMGGPPQVSLPAHLALHLLPALAGGVGASLYAGDRHKQAEQKRHSANDIDQTLVRSNPSYDPYTQSPFLHGKGFAEGGTADYGGGWQEDMNVPPPGYDLVRPGTYRPSEPAASLSEAGRYAPVRSIGERAANAALDYGPLPAKIASHVALQPIRAGEALGDAMIDPSLANITNAGVQGAMALFKPSMALKALGAGYGIAAAKDAGLSPFGPASAAEDGLTDPLRKRLEVLQRKDRR